MNFIDVAVASHPPDRSAIFNNGAYLLGILELISIVPDSKEIATFLLASIETILVNSKKG